MSFSVNDFKNNMIGGGARPTLFRVSITGKYNVPDFKFYCKATSIPASTLGVKTVSYMGHDVHFAGDRSFEDWTVTVYNDENFKVRNIFEKWSNDIDNHSSIGRSGGATENPASYVARGNVEQLSKIGTASIKNYTFVNMWPVNIGAIQLDWDAKDEIESFDVTFKYDYYTTDTTL